MSSKRCTKCGVVKGLSEFRPRKDGGDGRRAQCKSCMNAAETQARLGWEKGLR
jgi:hypothetical protein